MNQSRKTFSYVGRIQINTGPATVICKAEYVNLSNASHRVPCRISETSCRSMQVLCLELKVTTSSDEPAPNSPRKFLVEKDWSLSQIYFRAQGISSLISHDKLKRNRFNWTKLPKADETMHATCRRYGKCTIPFTHPNIRVFLACE